MTSDWTGIPEAEVRLIAGHVEGEGDMLGLHFVMAPKWKIYWRSPGDAGFPPRPDWSASQGARNMTLEWPLPTRFTFYGLETFGYGDEIVLPIRLDRTTDPAQIRLELFYAACAEICVPVEASLALDLPAGALPPNRHARAIAGALAATPRRSEGALDVSKATVSGNDLLIRMNTPEALAGPDLIVEGPADTVFGRPECRTSGLVTDCIVPLVGAPEDVALEGHQLRLTLSDSDYAAETAVTVSRP